MFSFCCYISLVVLYLFVCLFCFVFRLFGLFLYLFKLKLNFGQTFSFIHLIEFTYFSGISPAVSSFSSAGAAFVGSGLGAGGSGVTVLSTGAGVSSSAGGGVDGGGGGVAGADGATGAGGAAGAGGAGGVSSPSIRSCQSNLFKKLNVNHLESMLTLYSCIGLRESSFPASRGLALSPSIRRVGGPSFRPFPPKERGNLSKRAAGKENLQQSLKKFHLSLFSGRREIPSILILTSYLYK